jgi:hypothetical protein
VSTHRHAHAAQAASRVRSRLGQGARTHGALTRADGAHACGPAQFSSLAGNPSLPKKKKKTYHLKPPTSKTVDLSSRLETSEKPSMRQVNLPYSSSGLEAVWWVGEGQERERGGSGGEEGMGKAAAASFAGDTHTAARAAARLPRPHTPLPHTAHPRTSILVQVGRRRAGRVDDGGPGPPLGRVGRVGRRRQHAVRRGRPVALARRRPARCQGFPQAGSRHGVYQVACGTRPNAGVVRLFFVSTIDERLQVPALTAQSARVPRPPSTREWQGGECARALARVECVCGCASPLQLCEHSRRTG